MWRIEYIRAPRPCGVDIEDLPWQEAQLEPWIDPYNLVAMSNEKSDREASADGAYIYRIVEVQPQPEGTEMRWTRVAVAAETKKIT